MHDMEIWQELLPTDEGVTMAVLTYAPARATTVPRWQKPVRLTALHREHVARGAEIVERDGWLLPRSYGNAEDEAAALHEAVGLLDIGD